MNIKVFAYSTILGTALLCFLIFITWIVCSFSNEVSGCLYRQHISQPADFSLTLYNIGMRSCHICYRRTSCVCVCVAIFKEQLILYKAHSFQNTLLLLPPIKKLCRLLYVCGKFFTSFICGNAPVACQFFWAQSNRPECNDTDYEVEWSVVYGTLVFKSSIHCGIIKRQ